MEEKNYLMEAFQALKDLDLKEDAFEITQDGTIKAQDFLNDEETVETIIDPLAETEEELEDSYIGKVILDCIICQSKIYKDSEEVTINEEEQLANIGDICPYCQSVDGYKVIGEVAPYSETEINVDVTKKSDKKLNNTEKEKDITEDLQNVNIETDNETINISTTKKSEDSTEMIAPVSPDTESKFKTEESEYKDIDIDEFDETEFDDLSEKYLKRVYENVQSYKTVSGRLKGNLIKLEGVITFKSGKKAKTNFVFEGKTITKTGKLKFIGENKQFARNKNAFTLTGKMNKNKLIIESLTYNYINKDSKNKKSQKLYGTVRKVK